MLDDLSWRHAWPLTCGGIMFLGGLFHGFLKPQQSMQGWGVTDKIAASREAQIIFYGHSIRTSTLGLLVLVLCAQKNYTGVDTTMAIMGSYCGLTDVMIIWRYGIQKTAVVRFLSVLPIIFWGLAGMTAGPSL
ncbi:hypothetical protein B0O99DRAFT_628302 [Bisporella sp. PMI_857]|nr:hypothetical protein B0O99DRAFT_628302 [Bisporella sp. PMI_857]